MTPPPPRPRHRAGAHPCTHPYAVLTEDDATILNECGASQPPVYREP